MYPLTPAEIAADRADAIADDAGARLDRIAAAKRAAMEKIRAAFHVFADAADEHAMTSSADRKEIDLCLESVEDMLDAAAFPVTRRLEERRDGEDE